VSSNEDDVLKGTGPDDVVAELLELPVLVTQNIELFTHALSGITIVLILDKEPKYQTVRLNTGHLATLRSNEVSKR